MGGVPEHFNFLWHFSYTRDLFAQHDIALEWVDYSGGTGAMGEALDKHEIDFALMLTEGAVSQISLGFPFYIAFPWVISPLQWGVFIKGNAREDLSENIELNRFAVSRFQSGSHLMAMYWTHLKNLKLTPENFILTNNLDGARKSIANNEAQYFLWEKYMTRYLVDKGEFAQLDTVTPPWPAFVLVGNRKHPSKIALKTLRLLMIASSNYFKSNKEMPEQMAPIFHLKLKDMQQWFAEVEYDQGGNDWMEEVVTASNLLYKFGIIAQLPTKQQLLDS